MMRHSITPFVIPRAAYQRQLRGLVLAALREDIGAGDATVEALALGSRASRAHVMAKSSGILAGSDAFTSTIRHLDKRAKVQWDVSDGGHVDRGTVVAEIIATPRALLSGERTALNFLSRLSGVATATGLLVEKLSGSSTRLLDTRKTTPGWRYLEKQAALIGGAVLHRMGLHDALMIKSNHVVAVGDYQQAVQQAMKHAGKRLLICEARSVQEIKTALRLGVPWLLLDHFRGQRLRHAIEVIRASDKDQKRTRADATIIEVSGNINARTIGAIARYGPDYVSSGSITHSAAAVDFSLRWDEGRAR